MEPSWALRRSTKEEEEGGVGWTLNSEEGRFDCGGWGAAGGGEL